MNPPSEYPFGSAIEKQFNYVLGLLERDDYRYLQDSGAIKPLFEERRFEVQRRIAGPNNSPIFQIVYDAIDHLERLHSKLAEQQAIQASSLDPINISLRPKIGRINFLLDGLPLGHIDVTSELQNPANSEPAEVEPLDSFTTFIRHLTERAEGPKRPG